MTTPTPTGTRAAAAPILRAGAIVGVGAGVVNAVIFLIAKAAGVSLVVNQPAKGTAVIVAQPLVSSLVGIFLGAVVLRLLTGRAGGVALWTKIAYAVTALYSIYPFAAAQDLATALVLVVMHAVCLTAALLFVRPAAERR